MSTFVPTLLSALLAHSGFAALSFAMDRHQDALIDVPLSPTINRAMQGLGSALLLASLIICIVRWPVGVGFPTWCGVLTLSAIPLVLLLHYAPRWVRRTVWAAPLAALALLALALETGQFWG